MKILHIISTISPLRGGPSKAVLDMVKYLRKNGVDAAILTTNDHGIGLLDVPLNQWIEYQDIPVYFCQRFSPPIHSLREFSFSSKFTQWLWKNASEYDLLHIHGIFSYTPTISMLIARFQNIPYISRPLGHLDQWSLQQSYLKKKLYFSLIEKANLEHCQKLHLTSNKERLEIEALGLNTPSFILPHGVDLPEIIPNANQKLKEKYHLPEDHKIFLFMSRIHPKKGLDYLISALAKLNDQKFTLIIAGSGSSEYEQKIANLISECNLNSQVYQVGFVSGEDKNLLLQGSDLFILTSHAENFGIVVLEALAVGTPVLVTPGVALSELVKEEKIGYLTELNEDAIAKTLEYFLNHPQEAKIMGDQARKIVEQQYTLETIAYNLKDIYKTILKT